MEIKGGCSVGKALVFNCYECQVMSPFYLSHLSPFSSMKSNLRGLNDTLQKQENATLKTKNKRDSTNEEQREATEKEEGLRTGYHKVGSN